MKFDFDKNAIDRLTRLKLTSMLTEKVLIKTFNVSSYRLKKWKSEFDTTKLTYKDFIYGALRSLHGMKSIKVIIEYIDYKNKIRLTEKEVRRDLDKLVNEGHAYKDNDKWNYTQRLIESYSNKTKKIVAEVELGYFDLIKFKKIFKPKTWDYLMYECFDISIENVQLFKGIAPIDFNFDKFTYNLTCRKGE